MIVSGCISEYSDRRGIFKSQLVLTTLNGQFSAQTVAELITFLKVIVIIMDPIINCYLQVCAILAGFVLFPIIQRTQLIAWWFVASRCVSLKV
jgi:hypothetical protein